MTRAILLLGLSLAISCAPEPVAVVTLPNSPPIAQREEPEPPKAPAPVAIPADPVPPASQPVVPAGAKLDVVRDLRPPILAPRRPQLLTTVLQGLESLFAATPQSSPDRPNLIKRLADSYAELAAAALLPGGKPTTVRAARAKAISYYSMLVAQYPKWCAAPGASAPACEDETLYHLALEYERSGDVASARKAYFNLIKDHPQSSFVPGAYLAFGEMFFDEGLKDPTKLPLAEQSYVEVLKYPPSTNNVVWGYASFQLGRVRARNGNPKHAVVTLNGVIAWAQKHPDAPGAGDLSNAALAELQALRKP